MDRGVKKSGNPVIKIAVKGLNNLLHKVIEMDKKGISETVGHGEFAGKKDDNDLKVRYKYGIKIGLDDFVKKLKEDNK